MTGRIACTGPSCTNAALPHRELCGSHLRQQTRGKKLAPLQPYPSQLPRNVVTPERVELYRRIAEESKTGRSLFLQAEELGISHGQLKHLRVKAFVYGFEVAPVSPENRRGVKYEVAAKMDAEAAKVPRCRCGLALPCNDCTATNIVDHMARMHRASASGL